MPSRSKGNDFHLVLPAEPNAVRMAVRRAVARFARRITEEDAGSLELALAEALNNVAEHAYSNLPGGQIVLDVCHTPQSLQCRISDFGHPMPRLALPECCSAAPVRTVADLPEGGWGWMLIRELATELEYRRDGGCNNLTFKIPLADK